MKNIIFIRKSDNFTTKISKILVYCYLLSIFVITPLSQVLMNSLALHSFDSPKFQLYQVLTYPFFHAQEPTHLLWNLSFFIIFSSQLENLISKSHYLIMGLINIVVNVILINVLFVLQGDDSLMGISGFVATIVTVFLFFSNDNKLRFLSVVFILDTLIALKPSPELNFSAIGHFYGIIGGLIFVLYYKLSKIIKKRFVD
jgi:membrane associated rhomboid family serine protease